MFLINLNAEIVACILSFRKLRQKPNLENTSKYGFSSDLGGKNGGVLSMRMQVILDSSFARPGSAPIWGGKKGEFRDWTKIIANKLRQEPNIKGIKILRNELKMSQYADYTNLLGMDLASVEKALEVVENFGNLAGLKLNRKKTKAIWLGRWKKKQK